MHAPGGSQNCFAMLLRSRVMKIIFLLGFSFMFTAVYVNFFQHPPPDIILAMNGGASASSFGPARSFDEEAPQPHSHHNKNRAAAVKRRSQGAEYEEEDEDDDGDEDEVRKDDEGGEEEVVVDVARKATGKRSDKRVEKKSDSRDSSGGRGVVKFADYWQKFAKKNRLVTIGALYDRCENWHTQYGIVALMQDKELGGVKSTTFINIDIDKEMDGGKFSIEVKYNGKDLYDNYWEVCELEEELPAQNRTFNCPIAAGLHKKVKDRHIPGYLPKGRYETKAWVEDEDEKVIVCAYADFTI